MKPYLICHMVTTIDGVGRDSNPAVSRMDHGGIAIPPYVIAIAALKDSLQAWSYSARPASG